MEADKIAGQVLINKRSREDGGKDPAEPEKEADRQHGYDQPGGRSLWIAAART